jgi:hypothetical protein
VAETSLPAGAVAPSAVAAGPPTRRAQQVSRTCDAIPTAAYQQRRQRHLRHDPDSPIELAARLECEHLCVSR